MSEYYLARENQAAPLYVIDEDFETGAYSCRFTYPSKPIPICAKYQPDREYQLTDIILYPEFAISKALYDKLPIKRLYGSNWIPLGLIDTNQNEQVYMMLQQSCGQDLIDTERSIYKRRQEDYISGIKSLVLDESKLAAIPLHKRLIVGDEMWGFHKFFHRSIVELFLQEQATGVEFVPVSEFNESWAG